MATVTARATGYARVGTEERAENGSGPDARAAAIGSPGGATCGRMNRMEPTSQTESTKAASPMAERVLADRIVRTPGVRGGKPRISGHRITVADAAIR
jgi:hypothetical protein